MVKMVSRIVFLALVVFSLLTFSYPADTYALWAKRFDNNGWNDFGGIWPSEGGGYYLWGLTSDPNEPDATRKDYLLFSKLDSSGAVQWTKRIYTGDYDTLVINDLGGNSFFIQGMTSTTKGGDKDVLWAKFAVNPSTGSFTSVFQRVFRGSGDDSLGFGINESEDISIGTGTTNSFSGNPDDENMLVVKINSSNGNIEWSKVFDHGLKDHDPTVIPISGGYMLSSSVENAISGGQDIIVAKLNSTGVPQWAKLYGGTGISGATIHEISGGNYLLVGTTKSTSLFDFNTDIILIKINGSGDIVWQKKYVSDGMDTPGLTYENADGSFILTGSISIMNLSTFTFSSKILVMKLSSSGEILWKKTFGGGASVSGGFMKMDDGSYLLSGSITPSSTTPNDYDVLFGKYDSNFSPQWVRTFGGAGTDMGGIFPVFNQYMITGETDSFGGGDQGVMDIFGITLQSDGTYPDCQYFKDVTLTEEVPDITATDLDWTPTTTTLTQRTHTISLDPITLHIDTIANLTASDICAGTPEVGLSVTPSEDLNSSGTQGGPFTPSSKEYTLQNTGGASINWTASKTQAWVTLSATSGTLNAGATTTVTASINNNANSLSPNTYNDTITFTDTTNGSTITAGVILTVNAPAPGVLSVTPAESLTSSGTQEGPFTPPGITYTLQNTGGTSINWTASKTQAWVSLSTASGTLAAGATTTVTVSINSTANSLAAGPYTDTVTFTNTTNGNGNTTRSVNLTVNAPAPGVLSVTPPDNLTSSGNHGGPFTPPSITYTLQNTGGTSINWTASKTQAWVSLSTASGTLAAGATTTVTVSINANSLSPNTYNDTVTFTNTTNGNGNTTRNVNLTVNPTPGTLSVTPPDVLSSSGPPGGPFNPSIKNYTLQNTGGTAINWTVSKTQAWVDLSTPVSGTLAPGATTTVTVSMNSNANSLSPGNYNDTITFTNTTNGNGNTTRSVNLAVQGGLSITPGENLISTGFEGGPFTPLSKDYTLTNTGTASISWSATKTKTWVKLSKTSGSLGPGASITVTVTTLKGANVLDAGPFNDTVTFTNNTSGIGNTTKSVNLTVNPILITLSSPADGGTFTVCSYYSPAGPPTFNWTTSGGTLKKLELWFSTQSDFSSGLLKVKGSTASSNLLISASTWKKILLLPGQTGGIVHWKAVGTKGNNKTGDSDVRSFLVEGPEAVEAVDGAMLSHTSQTEPNPPTLSWKNNCNIKFKVWFYNDPDFYNNPAKSGVKKTTLSFSITNPNDNGGVFEKELTSGQWTAIKNLGSTIYWHVESSDVAKRSIKTGPMNFVITP